jgi:hypothetical protein
MRGRAIGAEVLFSRDPAKIAGMSGPFQASYVEGTAAENGEFYGERKALSLDEIKGIVTAMPERADCLEPNAADGTETAAAGHGEAKQEASEGAAAGEGDTHEVAASSH